MKAISGSSSAILIFTQCQNLCGSQALWGFQISNTEKWGNCAALILSSICVQQTARLLPGISFPLLVTGNIHLLNSGKISQKPARPPRSWTSQTKFVCIYTIHVKSVKFWNIYFAKKTILLTKAAFSWSKIH